LLVRKQSHKIGTLSLSQSIKGSALMLALFVMIVLMLLGTALVNVLVTSSESIAQEVYGTRALMAANSAMQMELQKLFPLDGSETYCQSESVPEESFPNFSDIPGLSNCDATTTCIRYATHEGISYFRLTSTGNCGEISAGNVDSIKSSRTVQVEARSL